jgi:hypothetical protein
MVKEEKPNGEHKTEPLFVGTNASLAIVVWIKRFSLWFYNTVFPFVAFNWDMHSVRFLLFR